MPVSANALEDSEISSSNRGTVSSGSSGVSDELPGRHDFVHWLASIRMLPALLNVSSTRGLMKRKPASTPGVLFVANRMQNGADICGHTFVSRSSTPFTTRSDVQRLEQGLACRRHPIALLKEQARVQREGNLAVWLRPLHRSPYRKGKSSTSLGKGGAFCLGPFCPLAMRATVSQDVVPFRQLGTACPGGIPDHEVVSPLMLVSDAGSQAAERRTFLYLPLP